jgi:hypothetical protein
MLMGPRKQDHRQSGLCRMFDGLEVALTGEAAVESDESDNENSQDGRCEKKVHGRLQVVQMN